MEILSVLNFDSSEANKTIKYQIFLGALVHFKSDEVNQKLPDEQV